MNHIKIFNVSESQIQMICSNIHIQAMQPSQIAQVIDLIHCVFMTAVAPCFDDRGIVEFLRYADEDKMLARQTANHFSLIAVSDYIIIGIIEIRNFDHISLLFVDSQYHRMGIGSALCQNAVDICVAKKPDLPEISVNASPNAVSAYERMGFIPTDEENRVNGIRFTPMSLPVKTPNFIKNTQDE